MMQPQIQSTKFHRKSRAGGTSGQSRAMGCQSAAEGRTPAAQEEVGRHLAQGGVAPGF